MSSSDASSVILGCICSKKGIASPGTRGSLYNSDSVLNMLRKCTTILPISLLLVGASCPVYAHRTVDAGESSGGASYFPR